jgi:hypothetical protein
MQCRVFCGFLDHMLYDNRLENILSKIAVAFIFKVKLS